MKRAILFLALLFTVSIAKAAPRYIESEIDFVSTTNGGTTPDVSAISLSTSAWTPCPAIANVNESRTTVFIVNYSTNSGVQNYILSNSATTPTVGIGLANFQLDPGASAVISIGANVYLWGRSLHTAAESACIGEARQRN